MELNINYHDEVWSKDEKKLGVANLIYHRPEGVDPHLKYYDSYLHVEDYDLGLVYFIPTDFIAEIDDDQRVILSKTRKEVLHNTWDRKPGFVAGGHADVVSLEPVAAA